MQRIIVIAIAAFAFVALATVGRVYLVDQHDTGGSGGSVKIGGSFNLVDHTGKTVTDQDFHGKYMLVYFGYTFCPDVCPTSLSLIAGALDQLTPAQLDNVVPVFITVDPERDTPEAMGTYVEHFHENMVGLSGTAEQIKDIARKYKAYYAKVGTDPDTYTMDHSSITYLMDPTGKYAAHFGHNTPSDQMAKRLADFL